MGYQSVMPLQILVAGLVVFAAHFLVLLSGAGRARR